MDIPVAKKNIASGDPCRILPFGSHYEVSCSNLLLSRKIAKSRKEDVEQIDLKVEKVDHLTSKIYTLENVMEVGSPCEVKYTSFLF